MKRKASSAFDLNKRQRRRTLYASNVETCAYHGLFNRNRSPMPKQQAPPREAKMVRHKPKDAMYQPLAPFQIRILLIEPGEFIDPLVTSLSTVDLLLEGGVVDQTTRDYYTYEAVSHNWADQEVGGFMQCNKEIVALEGSQYAMLKHLRRKTEYRSVWLDTVCINQNDIVERAAQVKKMFLIFKHAERVLIWLGLPKSRTVQVFAMIDRMKATRLLQKQDPFKYSNDGQFATKTPFIPGMCSYCHYEFALGIDELSTFPWFYRTWVRQEVFAAKAATIYCGSLEISWSVFVSHIKASSERLLRNPISGDIDAFAEQLKLLDDNTGKNDLDDKDRRTHSLSFVFEPLDQQFTRPKYYSPDLFSVLASSASFHSSDSRDIIYGVLGMSNTPTSDDATGRPFLKIDYSLDSWQVFRNATKYFIQREGCLDVMHLAQFNRDPNGRGSSWCPYWPAMNCIPGKLRQLCHVRLVDKRSHYKELAFNGETWPRIIDAGDFDVNRAGKSDKVCTFEGEGIQIEGCALGTIKEDVEDDGTRKLTFMALKSELELGTTGKVSCEGLNKACSDYVPLHIEHAAVYLNTLIEQIKNDVHPKTWPQEEIDRFCVAAVPASTRMGDIFCCLRWSSTFVILRPLDFKDGTCRAHFIGVAFVSRGIIDYSKLVLCDVEEFSMSFMHPDEEEFDSHEACNNVFNETVHGQLSSVHLSWSGTPSMPKSDDLNSIVHAHKSRNRTLPHCDSEVSLMEQFDCFRHPKPFFRRHFNGPIRSLRMTFDIL